MSVVIRLLAHDDLAQAHLLSSTAGWNQRIEDWAALTRHARSGSFGAFEDGRLLATAIGLDYRTFGWIAMMLVDPARRGAGLGRRLLEAAMEAIPGGLPIRLDATPMGRPLYQSHGFEDEAMLTRHVAAGGVRPPSAPPSATRRMVAPDLPAVRDNDRAVFGGERPDVITWMFESAQPYAHVIDPAGDTPQYGLGRDGESFTHLGPIVARDVEAAIALVHAGAAVAGGRPVAVDAFDANGRFGELLHAAGFEPQRPLFRMCRPGRHGAWRANRPPSPSVEFAILGPEFA